MSYGSRRLNRPGLRPQLQSGKKKTEQELPENTTPEAAPADSAHTTSAPIPVSGNSGSTVYRPYIRPNVGRAQADAGMVEGEWEAAYDESKSTARTWGILLVVLSILVWGAGFAVGFQTSLAVLTVISLVLAVFGLASPSLGLLAIGMAASLDAMANIFLLTGGLLRYNTLNYWLLVVMLLYIPFILRLRDGNSRTLQIFLLLLALELSFSTSKSTGIQDVLNIGVTFGMVVYFARGLKDELSLYWLGIVNGVCAGMGGAVYLLQMLKLPYANPNDWTYFQLTALFSICISYPFAVKYHKNRLPLYLLAAVNFAWIFLSASRGSLLIAMLCAAYLFLATRSITWKTMLIVVAIAIGVWVSANFADQQSATISRIQLLFDPTTSATKRTSKRSVIAEAGLRIFEKNPMGIGTGSFAEDSITTGLLASQRPAHSAWIKVLAENGVPGVILMTVFILSYAVIGFRRKQENRLLFALFITLTLAGAFVAKEFRGKSLWFLAAGGIALLHPKEMLAYLSPRPKANAVAEETGDKPVNYRQRLREVRFGRRR